MLALKSKIVLLFCVCTDELELRYKLHSSRDVEVLGSRVTNLADGHLHTVTIRRLADTISVQVHTQQIIQCVTQMLQLVATSRDVFRHRHCEPE